jgi:hypothetical protein
MKSDVKKPDEQIRETQVVAMGRRARQALLFSGAALGTALWTSGGGETKLPPFTGE